MEFTEVTQEEYLSFLKWLDGHGGYRVIPMTIADKVSIYHIEIEEKNAIANRYLKMYQSPETYDIRTSSYQEWKEFE